MKKHGIKIICLFSYVYWVWLIHASQMYIVHDALGYEQLGSLIHNRGLLGYFETGPHREPFYPFLISISMSLSSLLGVSYQLVQAYFQMTVLGLTQVVAYYVLTTIRVHKTITCGALIYIAISPALVNTGLSLFSEILTYPFVLGIVLTILKLSRVIKQKESYKKVILLSVLFTLCSLGFAFVRGVGMAVFAAFIVVGVFICVIQIIKNNNIVWKRLGSFILLSFLSFFVVIHVFKNANQKHNGQYTFTDRTAWMLYGSAERRVQPLTISDYVSGFLFAGGDGLCHRFRPKDECDYWYFGTSDYYGMSRLGQEQKNYDTPSKLNKRMASLAVETIINSPLRYTSVYAVDFIRHFFWESTKIGFVEYPSFLQKLYDHSIFKNVLRLGVSLLSLFSFVFCGVYSVRGFLKGGIRREQVEPVLYIFCFIVIYLMLVNFVTPLTRYALPVAPLFIVIIAVMIDRLCIFNPRPSIDPANNAVPTPSHQKSK